MHDLICRKDVIILSSNVSSKTRRITRIWRHYFTIKCYLFCAHHATLEAVQEHIYGRSQERRQVRLHLAELQRREQARVAPNHEDFEEMEDREIIDSDSGAEGDRDDLHSDNSEGFASSSSQTTSLEDRTLFYAMFVLLFGLSREQISWMELLMTVLYGKPPPITYEKNVAVLNKRITEEYDHQRYFFCTECSASMNEKEFACRNRSCTNFGIAVKRAKRLQRTEVHVINIIPQLTDVLVRGLEKIITMHQMLHDNRGAPTEDRSDIRLFEGYYHSIESAAEFAQRRLRILLTISLDGFVPRRVSKREMWPLYLRVEGLPPTEANKYFNSIIAGAIYSRLKPSEKMVEVLFSRLDSELRSVHSAPLEIVIGEDTWTIEVQLYRGVSDMPAQQLLYGVPRWNAEYGCSKCYIQGLRMGNQRVWVPSDDENALLRSDESYATDAEAQQFGLNRKTFMMDIMLPSHFLGDALHVCSEGITRNRLRDLFNSTSRFEGMRVSRESMENLKECLSRISSHSYSASLILSLDDLPTCKATEVDELAFVLFPLVAAVDIVPSPLAAAALLGYWFCVRLISKTSALTTTIIQKAQTIAAKTRDLWIMLAPQTFTMKTHFFFDHAMEYELTAPGQVTYQFMMLLAPSFCH